MQLEPPRGMRDFYPEDLRLRDRIFAAWREAAELHGFSQFEAPVVETMELLTRKAGEEVMRQIYHFTDKSDRELALRPEVTPSLVRMITARQNDILFPAKWWTIAQCFRYERMSRGRKREHFQWNVDVVGEKSVLAEAWVLACAAHALRILGLGPEEVRIHVNNRQLVAHLLVELGVPEEQHLDTFMILDKKGKVPVETLKEMLVEKGIAAATADAVLEHLGELQLSELSTGRLAQAGAARQVIELLDASELLGFRDYLHFDSGIVRGLSYYTGTVFEAFDTEQRFRAIFGGGRYDNLFEHMTGVPRPAVGLGFGDVVIAEILAARDGAAAAPGAKKEVCVGALDSELMPTAVSVAAELVAAGIRTDMVLAPAKPGRLLGYAARSGARFTVCVAPDEFQNGAVMVKDMAAQQQATVRISDVVPWLSARLTEPQPAPAGV